MEREGWIQTTSWFQPCAPGPGLEGVIGGAQGGAHGGASGGGRAMFSGHEATSTWLERKIYIYHEPEKMRREETNTKESIHLIQQPFVVSVE